MKFTFKQQCSCGGSYTFEAYGDAHHKPATCSGCGMYANLTDPLSVSRSAERLLYRSLYEMEGGDYSISILLSAIAVEHFLAGLYIHQKSMDYYSTHSDFPPKLEKEKWSKDKQMRGSFRDKSNLICKTSVGKDFEEYLNHHNKQSLFSNALGLSAVDYVQQELFERRNRIAHRGYVNSEQSEARVCHDIAVNVVSVLREIDKE